MVFKAQNNFRSNLVEDLNILQLDQNSMDIQQIKQSIRSCFINRKLHKGLSEVVNAIAYHSPLEHIYLVGVLDAWCESAIKNAILETKRTDIKIYRLDKKHRTLVYDVIKDLNIKDNEKERKNSRRFFLCRTFAY
jgi:hypothetical protein